MNTGFADAHNIAWKIAATQSGFDRKILDTYQVERQSIARTNSAQSLHNSVKMREVEQAIGVTADAQLTRQNILAVLNDAEAKAKVQRSIADQAEHFSMRGLDLGTCYISDLIINDGLPPNSPKPVSVYVPSTVPGTRLPHVWLMQAGQQISSLDLINYCELLLFKVNAASAELLAEVDRLRAQGYPLGIVAVGDECGIKPADTAFAGLFNQQEILLVRPDGHICWRCNEQKATDDLASALQQLLPR
jgi:2,4-dichlorophenol 6-monooxygenase